VSNNAAIIHVVTGSFLLLNTDLHIADITQHMSRNQFVKLTFDTIYANMPPSSERSSTPELIRDDSSSATQIVPSSGLSQVPPPNGGTSVQRSVSTPRGPRTTSVYSNLSAKDSLSGPTLSATHLSSGAHPGQEPKSRLGSSTSIGSSLFNKGWEAEVEGALKVRS
jgi:PH/SEC7 domain-containing protein